MVAGLQEGGSLNGRVVGRRDVEYALEPPGMAGCGPASRTHLAGRPLLAALEAHQCCQWRSRLHFLALKMSDSKRWRRIMSIAVTLARYLTQQGVPYDVELWQRARKIATFQHNPKIQF